MEVVVLAVADLFPLDLVTRSTEKLVCTHYVQTAVEGATHPAAVIDEATDVPMVPPE